MSLTVDKIISDAMRIAGRLKERTVLGDTLIMETEGINEQLETLRQVQEEFDALNQLGRKNTNYEMVSAINHEHPHIREIQMENRELRSCLQDHQRALEHIMSKYREHTQKKIFNSKIQFTFGSDVDSRFNNKCVEKILEMAAVMRQAAQIDDDNMNSDRSHEEIISRLLTENKGLREILQISKTYGGSIAQNANGHDKSCQTDDLAIEDDLQNDNNASLDNSSEITVISMATPAPATTTSTITTTTHINPNANITTPSST